ncbi:MAG: type II toxin-antitoxin system HicA family toxin [Candidatus Aenigmarchaeota archaeon]|nr:type II toxin-antitoxin system HicA family toxin [Candidatus Aenigmarchaeota archaeon]
MRLVPIAIDRLIKVFRKMGFQPVRQSGGHLIVTNPNGKSIPIPVHGRKEIDPRMLNKLLKQAGINREEFFKLLKQILILFGIASRRDVD